MRRIDIAGCGYVGQRLAARCLAAGAEVRGSAVSAATLAAIASIGARAVALDLDADLAPQDLAGAIAFYCVPPPREGERDTRLERWLGALAAPPARIVYLSTTGVYGDAGGARVDEDTPPAPRNARAVRRLAAERTLAAWCDAHAVSFSILRVPGIYGPGRLPLERLRQREPAIEPREASPGNRIQVEDLVTACIAAGQSPRAHRRTYNATDGTQASATEFLQRVAAIAGLPPPPLVSRAEAQRTFSQATWSFLGESRRVDNRRLVEELGVALRYHDLATGIRASL